MDMKRTSWEFDETVLAELRRLAQQEGQTVSHMVREAVAEYVTAHRSARTALPFKALGASGVGDLSERVDDYLAAHADRAEGWSV